MNENETDVRQEDRRTESREALEHFYSVEVALEGSRSRYQFKLRNISTKGLCIVVREDSAVIDSVDVGDVLQVALYQNSDPKPDRTSSARICHITRQVQGRYQGHYLVGLEMNRLPQPESEPPPEPA